MHEHTAERLFLREWALELIGQAVKQVEEGYTGRGQAALFDALKESLTSPKTDYGAKSAELDMTPGAVRVAVHRLRARYREALYAEVSETLDAGEDVERELDSLLAALQARP